MGTATRTRAMAGAWYQVGWTRGRSLEDREASLDIPLGGADAIEVDAGRERPAGGIARFEHPLVRARGEKRAREDRSQEASLRVEQLHLDASGAHGREPDRGPGMERVGRDLGAPGAAVAMRLHVAQELAPDAGARAQGSLQAQRDLGPPRRKIFKKRVQGGGAEVDGQLLRPVPVRV